MSEEQKEEEIIYQGHSVPKILKAIYVTFILWGIFYFVVYGIPDLKMWLSKN